MKTIDFIINPISGAGNKKRVIRMIEKELDRSRFQWSYLYTSGPGDATVLAGNSTADIVCAVGGDGTLNEVARGLLGNDRTFALIPCGSGDGLALHLGISRNPRKAVRNLNTGVERTIDCGTINGREFFSICGTGLDAIVSYRFATAGSRGLKTYISEALKTWKGFVFDEYDITVDGTTMSRKAALVTVGNSDQWGNNARITPLADASDGLLDITVIKPFRTIDIPGLAIRLMTGRLAGSDKVICLKGKNIHIEKQGEFIAHFDGDPCTFASPLDIKVIPSALKIIVPEK
ncbi:MAG: YegS/Rv2252/BmrU family lipid kinase [Bacteroidales bacterium]|nr:YegS/Rv2252/BmrU family lipid kinase [Bacteroidales bacterium]